jgi:hypothetical protein
LHRSWYELGRKVTSIPRKKKNGEEGIKNPLGLHRPGVVIQMDLDNVMTVQGLVFQGIELCTFQGSVNRFLTLDLKPDIKLQLIGLRKKL